MCKLKGMRCYLAGAMSFDPDGKWREEIGDFLRELGVKVLDPTNKPIAAFGVEDREKQKAIKGYYDEYGKMMKMIRCVDLRLVDIADFLVVSIDLRIYSIGTWEELFWANRQKKPIIVRCAQGKREAPPWLFGTIPHSFILSDWEEVKNYLRLVDGGLLGKDGERWYFFQGL